MGLITSDIPDLVAGRLRSLGSFPNVASNLF